MMEVGNQVKYYLTLARNDSIKAKKKFQILYFIVEVLLALKLVHRHSTLKQT